MCEGKHGVQLVQGCEECRRLTESYEAETMKWFRLEGHLRIAEYGRDKTSAGRIASDLDATTRKRSELRALIVRHEEDCHNRRANGGPLVMGA
jgi:hypothetical protein